MGAWVRSLRYFAQQVVAEVTTTNSLGISADCQDLSDTYQSALNQLGALSFQNQPNVSSIDDGANPCPSDVTDGTSELTEFMEALEANPDPTANHFDPFLVENRVSGCLMLSARKKIETAYAAVAQCEVYARAAATDREAFLPGSPCSGSKTKNLSLFQQTLVQNVMKAKCEPQAYQQCTTGMPAACRADPNFNLNSGGCWACYSAAMLACYQTEWPKDLSQGVGAAFQSGYPATLPTMTLSSTPSRGVNYGFVVDDCQNATSRTAGCPDVATTLEEAELQFAIQDLNQITDTSAASTSPLKNSLDLDRSVEDQDEDSSVAVPLPPQPAIETIEFKSPP
jgi:hypothetical protein